MNEYIEFIQTVGFPIFMVLWFILRTEKIIENNTKALNKMCNKIDLEDEENARGL